MLLANGDLRIRSTNTGCSDRVPSAGAIEWPLLKKEDWPRHRLKEPVQLSVVFDLTL
jgi:hypothetical protein